MSVQDNYHFVQTTRASRVAGLVGVVILVALITAPWWAGRGDLRLLSEIFLYLSLAALWNLLAGYAGLVSVGQQAFVGLGGYGLFALAMFFGVHPLLAVPLVALIAAIVALPVAVLIFRLSGAYFAIGTWVIAEVFRLGFAQVTSLGGGSGTSLPIGIVKSIAASRSMRDSVSYWMALAMIVLVLAVVYFWLRSRHGFPLTAIRDNELAAKSLGVDIWRTKFQVYVLTAGLTASVGALIFLQKLRISPDAAFSVNDWTAYVIFIVVIGGIGTIEGPIIGTLVFFLLRGFFADLGTAYLIILGLVAIVVILKSPTGIWGYVNKKYDIALFPLARRVIRINPSNEDRNAS
jgi:branched-chain amino acid transport system permease protein